MIFFAKNLFINLGFFRLENIWILHSLTQMKSKIILLKLLHLELIFLQYLRLCLCLQYLRHFGFEKETTCPSLIFWFFCGPWFFGFFVGGVVGTFFMDHHASCKPPFIAVLHEAWGFRSNPTFGKIKWVTPILSTKVEAATP